MSITRQVNKEIVVFSYNATNIQQWKEHISDIFNNMDESQKNTTLSKTSQMQKSAYFSDSVYMNFKNRQTTLEGYKSGKHMPQDREVLTGKR